MIKERLLIRNKLGLHARVAVKLVELTRSFNATISVTQGERSASADSVLGLLLLESAFGEYIDISAEGEEAIEALAAIKKLFKEDFNKDISA